MILEKTVDLVKQIYKIRRIVPPQITKVVIGLGYTGVEVTAYAYEPFLGLASTLQSVLRNTNCTKIDFAGELTGYPITKLLNWSLKSPSLEKIIGIATLNGVSQHILKIVNPYKKIKEESLSNIVEINSDTRIIFIGLIKPLIKEIHKLTSSVIVIEDSLLISSEFKNIIFKHNIEELNEEELYTDILICTGTALINNTIELILEKFKNRARKIILIGPTASMIPDILFDYGVDIVGGMEILDSDDTIKVLQEGGGTRLFRKYGKKYNLIKD